MTFAQLFIVLVTIYAIVMTCLFLTLRAAFNTIISVTCKQQDQHKEAVQNFLKEADWLLKYTESEEVEKSVNKLKAALGIVE